MRRLFLIFSALTFFYPSYVTADAGLPMLVLGVPFLVILLIPVCAIEVAVIVRRSQLSLTHLWKPVALANVASTFIGYPLAWLLQLAIEFITPRGGNALGLGTVWNRVFAVTIQSAWLIPYETALGWMIPIAGMVGLVPAFFISVWLEGTIERKMSIHSAVFSNVNVRAANLASYLFLFAILVILLIRALW
ncbi:MAG: hypothetical protein HY537_02090 [Deltaproteobacteria bacterium]|nr:hypothetical protein [Deltaproteobacteria bacterium]